MITIQKGDRNKTAILFNGEILTTNPIIGEADKDGFITVCYSLPQKIGAGTYPIHFSPDGTEWTAAIYEVRLLKLTTPGLATINAIK